MSKKKRIAKFYELTDLGKDLLPITQKFAEDVVEERNNYLKEIEELSKKYGVSAEDILKGSGLSQYFMEAMGFSDDLSKQQKLTYDALMSLLGEKEPDFEVEVVKGAFH
ncbi:MAG: hypothetical protein ACW981_16650 [Candidatus Hodarchaeales archaeon]|jgi:hypothetical protein